jgi:hypothetical protein
MLSLWKKTHKLVHALVAPRQSPTDGSLTRKGALNLLSCKILARNIIPTVPLLPEEFFEPFANFRYTGTVHAVYPLAPMRIVPDHIPRPDYAVEGKIFGFVRRMSTILRGSLIDFACRPSRATHLGNQKRQSTSADIIG